MRLRRRRAGRRSVPPAAASGAKVYTHIIAYSRGAQLSMLYFVYDFADRLYIGYNATKKGVGAILALAPSILLIFAASPITIG